MGERATVTVMFSDVVSSTELLARHGDAAFDAVRRALTALTERAVSSHGGRVVKTLGDGAMATFPSAAASLWAAMAIQRSTAAARKLGDEPLLLRVGVSVGDVIFDGDEAAPQSRAASTTGVPWALEPARSCAPTSSPCWRGALPAWCPTRWATWCCGGSLSRWQHSG